MADQLQTRRFLGGAQIIGGDGNVIRRKDFSSGAGFVIADVPIKTGIRKKHTTYPSDYWIPDLPFSYLNAWNTTNPKAKEYYNSISLPYYLNHCKN